MNMSGPRVLGGVTVLLQNQKGLSSASQPLDSLFLSGSSKNSSSSSSSSFLGSRSMMSFQNVHGGDGSNTSLFQSFDHDENGDDEFDEYFHQPGKKRRLTVDQVQFLEKSFELENKLEPERKIQLAKDLGLQPRQVAIWFQNRRARWKTKQLEKDYEALLANYNSLEADYESLFKENDKLKAEILALKDKLLLREKEGVNLELSETNKLLEQTQKMPSEEELALKDEVSKVSAMVCKQEDISSAKSDILDADSPSRYTDGAHSSVLMEPADSSYVFEPDQSDLSQDEEDNLNKTLFPSYIFPKLEYEDYSDPPASSCNFGFPAVEDNAFWSWSY